MATPTTTDSTQTLHQRPSTHLKSTDERDATELSNVNGHGLTRVVTTSSRKSRYGWRQPQGWVERNIGGPIVRFWGHNVYVAVPAEKMRDHLALERTFLGYLRTSLSLSMTGVIVAQLFRLQHVAKPSSTFGYYTLGIPLAATFIAGAIVVTLVGAFRFWKQQDAMCRDKVYAGGWEIYLIMVGSIALVTFLFAICVGVDITKEL